MKLTDERIAEIASTPAAVVGSYVHTFARAIEAEVLRINGGGGEAHDDAKLQALGWQRISCPVCGADGARAAPQPQQAAPGAVLEGWQLVPVDATHEMCLAAHDGPNCGGEYVMQASDREYWEACYRAMLSAAPKPQGE